MFVQLAGGGVQTPPPACAQPLPSPGLGLMLPPSCLLNILAILGPGILEGWTQGNLRTGRGGPRGQQGPREGAAGSPSPSAQQGGAPASASQPQALLAAD